jgi:hypothetical protein
MYYDSKEFLKVRGYKFNCIELESGEEYWISGCKANGDDTLYGGHKAIPIDEDAREEYWTTISKQSALRDKSVSN